MHRYHKIGVFFGYFTGVKKHLSHMNVISFVNIYEMLKDKICLRFFVENKYGCMI